MRVSEVELTYSIHVLLCAFSIRTLTGLKLKCWELMDTSFVLSFLIFSNDMMDDGRKFLHHSVPLRQ